MTDPLEVRLAELRRERAQAEAQLAEVLAREAELRQRLLRIDGAIQVMEEMSPPPAGS